MYNGDIDSIHQLLGYNCDVNIPDDRGFSPLLIAIDKGSYDIVSILLKHKCDIQDRDVRQALLKGEVDILLMMLHTGKYDMCAVDQHQRTYLHIAAIRGYHELIYPLIHAGCDVNKQDDTGRTALISAVENGHCSVVFALINPPSYVPCMPADMNVTFGNGQTALFVAVKRADSKIVRALLKKKECDTNICCNGDCQPMRLAVYNQSVDIVRLLLERDDCKLEFDPPVPSILC